MKLLVTSWAAYGVCGWAFIFGAWHLYWALGGRLGLLTSTGGNVDELAAHRDQAFVALGLWGVVVLCLVLGLIALAMARPWGRVFPRWALLVLAWAACAVMLLRGVVYLAVSGLAVAGVIPTADPSWHVWNLALFSPFFVVGGVLVGAMARHYARTSSIPGKHV